MYEINGKTYTAEQIAEAAKAYNLSVDEYVTKLKAKYEAGKSQGSATPTASVEPQPSSTESKSADTSSVSPEKPKKKKVHSDAAARVTEILSGKLATGPAETVEQISASQFEYDPEDDVIAKKAEAARKESKEKDLGITDYTLNTLGNLLRQAETTDDRIKLAFNAIASTYPGAVGPVPQVLEKLGVDMSTTKAVREIRKAEARALPTGEFTEIGSKKTVVGEVMNVGGALINAGASFGYSALENFATLGVGLAGDMIATSIADYNQQKADAAGKTTAQLFNDGEGEILTPLITGTLGYSLERIGIKGVGRAINNLKGSAIKQAAQFLQAFAGEGGTEYFQGIIDEYSGLVAKAKGEGKKIAGDVAQDIAAETAQYAFSKPALESLLQGGFGGVGAAAIGGGFKPYQSRSKDENDRINNNIKSIVDAQAIVSNPESSDISKQAAKEVIKTAKAEIKGDVELGNNRYRVMTASDRRSIDKSFSDLNKFRTQYQAVYNDASLSAEEKETTLKGIEAKANKAQDNIFNKRVAADAEIQELKKLGRSITAFGFDTKVLDASELDTPSAKKAIEEGIFGYLDGDTIVLNKQAIREKNAYATGRHEFFHRFIQNEINKNPEFLAQIKGQVRSGLRNMLGADEAAKLIDEIEKTYGKQGDKVVTEEIMAQIVERLKANPDLYKTSGFQKIKNFFKDLLQSITGIKIKTDDDVLKFLNDFNRSFDKGRFTRAQKKFGRGKLRESGIRFSVDYDKMFALDDKLNSGEITVDEYDAQMEALLEGEPVKEAAPSEEVEIEGQTFTVDQQVSEEEFESLDDKLASGEIDIDTYFEQLDAAEDTKPEAKPSKEKKERKAKVRVESKKLGNAIDALVPPGTTKAQYDKENINKVAEKLIVGDMLNPLIKKIATYYGITADNVYGQSFGDFFAEVKGERLIRNIQKFNPERNDSLAGYVIGSAFGVRNRVKEALEKFKKLKDADDQARVEGTDIATETAEDTIKREAETKEAAKQVTPKVKYGEMFDIQKKIPKLQSVVEKAIGMSIRKYQEQITKNVSISPFAKEFRTNIGNLLEADMVKYMKDYGYEQFLKDVHKSFLTNSSITFLAKHPVFRQVIEKKIKGKFVTPTKVSSGTGKFKYEYMLPDGSRKATRNDFDREKMAVRGKTSGDQINRKVKNPTAALSQDAFVDYHFKDGAGRKVAADNPRKSTGRQIIADVAMDIFKDDLAKDGPLSQAFADRMDLLEIALGDDFARTVANDLNSTDGNIRFSKLVENIVSIPGYENYTKDNVLGLLNRYEEDSAKFRTTDPEVNDLFISLAIDELGIKRYTTDTEDGNKSVDDLISNDADMQSLGFTGDLYNVTPPLKDKTKKYREDTLKKYYSAITTLLDYMPRGFVGKQVKQRGRTPYMFLKKFLGFEGNGQAMNGLDKDFYGIILDNKSIFSKHSEVSQYWEEFENLGGFAAMPMETTAGEAGTFNRKLKNIVNTSKSNASKIKDINKLPGIEKARKNGKILRAFDYAILSTINHVANEVGPVGSKERNKFISDLTPLFSNQSRYGKRLLAPFTSINLNPNILKEGKYRSGDKIRTKEKDKLSKPKGEHLKPMVQMNFLELKMLVTGGVSRENFDFIKAGFENSLGEEAVFGLLDQMLGATTAASKEARLVALELLLQDFKQFSKGKGVRPFVKNVNDLMSVQGSSSIYNWVDGKYEFEKIIADQNRELLKQQSKEINKFKLGAQPDATGNLILGDAYNEKVRFSKPISNFQYTDKSTILERKDALRLQSMIAKATGIKDITSEDENQVRKFAKRNKIVTAFKTGVAAWYDLEQFFYPLYSEGQVGKVQQRMIHNKVITPLIQGLNNFNAFEMSTQQQIATLNKGRKGMGYSDKDITQDAIPGYSVEDAIRVWIYRTNDYTIPGISDENIDQLFSFVNDNADLRRYALNLRRIFTAYPWAKPTADWINGNLITDINSVMGTARMEMLTRFKENIDQIFTADALKKLERKFGEPYVKYLKLKIKNVYTGKPPGGTAGIFNNSFVNGLARVFIAGSMWMNFKSGIIQLASTTNYLVEDMPVKYMLNKSFAKEYARAIEEIKKSDFFKQRRRVGKFDVVARESHALGKDVTWLQKFILEKGYIPTKLGDAGAILIGGAAHYAANYLKARDGENPMSEDEAREYALVQFIEATESAQQSSRADRLGFAQQAPAWRYLTTYTNTQQQQMRKITNAIRDRYNGRISSTQAFAKILNYAAVAPLNYLILANLGGNMVDYVKSLLAGGDDDEYNEDAKKFFLAYFQSMAQGFGPLGIIIDKFLEEIFYQLARNGVDYYGQDFYKRLANLVPFVGSISRPIDKFGKELDSENFTETIVPAVKELVKTTPVLGKTVKVGEAIARSVEGDVPLIETVLEVIGWSEYTLNNLEEVFTPEQKSNFDKTLNKVLSPSTEKAINRASDKAKKLAKKYSKKYK